MSDLLEREPLTSEERLESAAAASAVQAESALPMPKVPAWPAKLSKPMIALIEARLDLPAGTRLRDAAARVELDWEYGVQGRRDPDATELAAAGAVIRGHAEQEIRAAASQNRPAPFELEAEVRVRLKSYAARTAGKILRDAPRAFFDAMATQRPKAIAHFEALCAAYLTATYGGEVRRNGDSQIIGIGSLHVHPETGRITRTATDLGALFETKRK